jgi:uncharacterized membrane protein
MALLSKKQFLWATFVLAVVVLLQIVSIANKGMITGDEGVSYIAATGHQGNYQNISLEGKWVNIAEWKKLWRPDNKMCFGTISKDLAEYDIHPPLYFWFLHVWILLTGTSIWSGAFLNLFFLAGIFFCLIIAGMKVLNSFKLSLGMAFIWGVSPAVMAYMKESRQYALLALFTAIFLILILDLLQKEGKLRISSFIPITVTAAAGTLTHYYFALFIAAASLVILAKCYNSGKWELFKKFLLSMIASIVLFIVVHPNFYLSFIRQQEQAKDFVAADLSYRILMSVKAFVTYYFPGIFSKPGFAFIILLICILLVLLIIKPDLRLKIIQQLTYIQKVVLFLFLFISLTFVGLYLAFISPAHSIIAKYLSMIHIFIVLSSFIILLQFRGKIQKILFFLLCLWQFSMGIYFIQKEHKKYSAFKQHPDSELFDIHSLIIDMPGRTVVPSILWYFPDNVSVFIAYQDSLLANPDEWISQLGNEFVYISDLRPDNTVEKRQQIVKEIENFGFHLQKSDTFFYNKVSTYYSFLR